MARVKVCMAQIWVFGLPLNTAAHPGLRRMASFCLASLDQPWGFACTFVTKREECFVAPSLIWAPLSHRRSPGGESQLPHLGPGGPCLVLPWASFCSKLRLGSESIPLCSCELGYAFCMLDSRPSSLPLLWWEIQICSACHPRGHCQ